MAEVTVFNNPPSHGPECGGNVSAGKRRVISASQYIIKMKKNDLIKASQEMMHCLGFLLSVPSSKATNSS